MIKKALVVLVVAVGLYWYFSGEEEMPTDALVGKKVLVTGSSSGIGEQIAYQFAKHGADVFLTARRENLLQKVVAKCKEIGRKGAKFGYVPGDMNSAKDPDMVVKKAVSVLGGLDILVLNHAYVTEIDFWKGTDEDLKQLEKIMNINFHSFVRLASSAIPHLNKTQGSIHVVSSDSGRIPTTAYQGYSASKFALEGFFGSLRSEFEKTNTDISVTVSVLGLIDTQGAATAMAGSEKAYGISLETLLKHMEMGDPAEAGYRIMKSTALRQREMFYPPSQAVKFFCKLYALSPELFEWQKDFLLDMMKE